MNKRNVYIGVIIAVILTLIYFTINFVINISGKLVSSVDGEKFNSNYSHIFSEYKLFRAEKSICMEREDGSVDRITLNVDSLSWDKEEIVGFSRGRYFLISIPKKSILYFDDRKELFNYVDIFPKKSLPELPPLTP